jgi:PAS domain S-box-containing protein
MIICNQGDQEFLNTCNAADISLSDYFEIAPEALCIVDSVLDRFIACNENAITLLKYNIDELSGFGPGEVSPIEQPDHCNSKEKARSYAVAALKGEKPVFDWILSDKFGKEIPVEARLVKLGVGEGKLILVSFVDITERKRAEQQLFEINRQLEKSEKKFKNLSEKSYDLIAILDENMCLIYRSPANERICGWTDKENHAFPVISRIHPEDRELLEKVRQQLIENPTQPIAITFRARHKAGHYIWLDGTLTNMLHDESIGGIICNLRDISANKRSEETIRTYAANLSAIIENTDAMIYSVDRNFRYVFFNHRLKAVMKVVCGLEIQIGDGVFEFLETLEPQEAKYWENVYSRALKGDILEFEKEFMVDGNSAFVKFSVHPIWERNMVIGLSCFANDITKQKTDLIERERITADLIQRNVSLKHFSHVISHNLRAPVANILGIAQLIKGGLLNGKELDNMQDHIFKVAVQLDNVIKDLGEILHAGSPTKNKEAVQFQELVDDIRIAISDVFERENVELTTDFKTVTGFCSVKPFLFSIFYNLILNSIKYRHRQRRCEINVSSHEKNGHVVLIFRDNGIGIDLQKHGKDLFGLYKRFHPGIEGKGMGLSMVKTQVEALGGRISVESEPDAGCVFRVELGKNECHQYNNPQ